ncbi:MAG: DUF4381 family protein [SAR324 cluster bacterium]|nr:DUF4381 family protein [SAR324 cluster bacterium]
MNRINTWLILLMAMILTGCKSPISGTPEQTNAPEGLQKVYERGPLQLTLTLNKTILTIAETLELNLVARLSEDHDIKWPKFGENLEKFGIRDYRSPAPKLLENGLMEYQKTYVLEPFLSGEYLIPSITLYFWKKDEQPPQTHELSTEPVTLQVASLLPENIQKQELRENLPPVEMPISQQTWLLAGFGATLLVLAGAGGWWFWRKRKRRETIVPERPPHETAYEALEHLVRENLIEKGEIKEYYLRLSNILRHYIEHRFLIKAPEQTTEEFLTELRNHERLAGYHKDLLKNFLKHCDLVKFAKHQPQQDEIQQAFHACRQFIEDTSKGGTITENT